MKSESTNKIIRRCSLLIACLVLTAVGCAKTGPKVKSPKVPNAAEVSNACAQKLGFDEWVTTELARALKNYDSKLSDEFKLRAMVVLTESDKVEYSERNTVLKEYFSCLQSAASK